MELPNGLCPSVDEPSRRGVCPLTARRNDTACSYTLYRERKTSNSHTMTSDITIEMLDFPNDPTVYLTLDLE
jgi:hypothetical protein